MLPLTAIASVEGERAIARRGGPARRPVGV